MNKKCSVGAAVLLGISCISSLVYSAEPRLIVQIIIDQLRGDLLHANQKNFGKNGFNYLMSHGVDYNNAHHPHANTTTCAGHATISTGAYPALHGIVDNEWYDRDSHKIRYCVEDLKAPILVNNHTKIQPEGRSPRSITASTFSDELMLAQKGRAFGVSMKDRAAITLAGHAGTAYWFDKKNGGIITSTYYKSEYPAWISAWNKAFILEGSTWKLSRDRSSYRYKDAARFNNKYASFGSDFPHQVGKPADADFMKYYSMTPLADELIAQFAMDLITQEQLGKKADQTDYIGVSFSTTDVVGHQFGPNSIESEDNLLRLDQTIASFLQKIDAQVGLDNTLIVLTADHGVSDSRAYLRAQNMPTYKPINITALKDHIQRILSDNYDLPASTILNIEPPYVYLDHQLIHQRQLSVPVVASMIAESLTVHDGLFRAFSLPASQVNVDWLSRKVNRMAYPERAGDIYLVAPPSQSLRPDWDFRVSHGTPWNYDSYVPLIFSSGKMKPKLVTRPVYTTDIAKTLSAVLGIKAPSAAVGVPLKEVLR